MEGTYSALAPFLARGTNCGPPLLELDVQLSGLEHTDEHEDKSTPSEDDLHEPSKWLGGECRQLRPAAVSGVPKRAAAAIRPALMLGARTWEPVTPWRVTVTTWSGVKGEV